MTFIIIFGAWSQRHLYQLYIATISLFRCIIIQLSFEFIISLWQNKLYQLVLNRFPLYISTIIFHIKFILLRSLPT
jgi:hypothetical protein